MVPETERLDCTLLESRTFPQDVDEHTAFNQEQKQKDTPEKPSPPIDETEDRQQQVEDDENPEKPEPREMPPLDERPQESTEEHPQRELTVQQTPHRRHDAYEPDDAPYLPQRIPASPLLSQQQETADREE